MDIYVDIYILYVLLMWPNSKPSPTGHLNSWVPNLDGERFDPHGGWDGLLALPH